MVKSLHQGRSEEKISGGLKRSYYNHQEVYIFMAQFLNAVYIKLGIIS